MFCRKHSGIGEEHLTEGRSYGCGSDDETDGSFRSDDGRLFGLQEVKSDVSGIFADSGTGRAFAGDDLRGDGGHAVYSGNISDGIDLSGDLLYVLCTFRNGGVSDVYIYDGACDGGSCALAQDDETCCQGVQRQSENCRDAGYGGMPVSA